MTVTLEEASIEEIVAELSRRSTKEVVASVWTLEDARAVFSDDDDLPQDLNDQQQDELAGALLQRAASGLADVLGQRGNDYLSDRWHLDSSEIIAEILPSTNTP